MLRRISLIIDPACHQPTHARRPDEETLQIVQAGDRVRVSVGGLHSPAEVGARRNGEKREPSVPRSSPEGPCGPNNVGEGSGASEGQPGDSQVQGRTPMKAWHVMATNVEARPEDYNACVRPLGSA